MSFIFTTKENFSWGYFLFFLLPKTTLNKPVYSYVYLSADMYQVAILLPKTSLNKPLYSFVYLCADMDPAAILLTKTTSNKPLYSCGYLCAVMDPAAILLPNLTVNKPLYYCASLLYVQICFQLLYRHQRRLLINLSTLIYIYVQIWRIRLHQTARMRCCRA